MENTGEKFIENTKYHHMGLSDQAKGFPAPDLQIPYPENGETIFLPDWNNIAISDENIVSIINNRQSIRNYRVEKISLSELSYLLWCTQGVKEIISNVATIRTVPSAGARHALETIVLVNNVEELTPGLYRYLSLQHRLGIVKINSTMVNKIVKASFYQDFISHSAVTFIWIAIPYRMRWRYGERGYRYLFLDAGHVAQNLYLSAQAIDCGVCVIGAFSDDELNEILNIDGKEQFVIYMATVGKKLDF